MLVAGAGYSSLSMKVSKFCIVQAVLVCSDDELVWQAGGHRERALLPGAEGGGSDQIQVITVRISQVILFISNISQEIQNLVPTTFLAHKSKVYQP